MIGGKRLLITSAFSFLLCFTLFGASTVHRGRNEGTMNIPASNVVGNGNITLSGGMYGGYGTIGRRANPSIGAVVGISDIMQLRASTSFANFKGLGTTEAHFQLTTPGNDHLRFFGLAIAGSLYLSTAADTISRSTVSGKPDYNSYLLPSAVVDFDWLALFRSFPLKTYILFSMVDEPELLYRYDQISLKTGIEWKMSSNSWFCEIGAGLYKEKTLGSTPGDPSYQQRVVWFEPGLRYRFFERCSALGSLHLAVYQQLKERRSLPTTAIRAAGIMEFPLLFRETNTEAIRTLVFMNREKEKKKDHVEQNIEQGRRVESGLDRQFKTLEMKSGIPDSSQEAEELKKREEIQKKMNDIEKMLEESQ